MWAPKVGGHVDVLVERPTDNFRLVPGIITTVTTPDDIDVRFGHSGWTSEGVTPVVGHTYWLQGT